MRNVCEVLFKERDHCEVCVVGKKSLKQILNEQGAGCGLDSTRVNWRTLTNTVMKLRVSCKPWSLLTS
jgi:hypothetical protein